MTQISNADWKLKDLTVRLQEYGEYKGKYIGKIQFTNKDEEAFTFNVSQEKTHQLLNIIKDQLVTAATNLGENLMNSLGLLAPPEPKKEIGTIIEHEPVNQ